MTQQTGTADTGGTATARPTRPPRSLLSEVRPVWSWPACLRAVRATVVVPGVMALTFVVIGNLPMTVFAVFGAFGSLVMTSFSGTRRDRAVAHAGLALAGSAAIVIGTLASGSTWLAVLVTLPVAFVVTFAGVAGPNVTSAVTAVLLIFVLPVASAGGPGTIGWRLAGWWLASIISTAAVLLVSPRPTGDRLRAAAGACATALAHHLESALQGTASPDDRQAMVTAERDLMAMFAATPYRPVGLAAADQGLSSAIHGLEWCAELIHDATGDGVDLAGAAPQERRLLEQSAVALRTTAALLAGHDVQPDMERMWHARAASAAHLRRLEGDPDALRRQADLAFHAQVIGVATSAAAVDALIAAGRVSPPLVADLRQRWLAGGTAGPVEQARTRRKPTWMSTVVGSDANVRSVWFRNSARAAVALAAAVGLAKLVDVQHTFWVVLGTLSVLRTNAATTGATAMRALTGTTVGFIVGTALLIGIGDSSTALWVAFPLAVLVAAYAPGAAPFMVGQAAFTITVVVLFNLLAPAGWQVGLVRVEDVAIGCGVSIVVGVLFWPRGASSLVGDNLADAFRCGATYLTEAVGWALGRGGRHPDQAVVTVAAGTRLDDALRAYLTEQGSNRLPKDDLWTLTMAAQRLRLTSHSLATLPGGTAPSGPPLPADDPVPSSLDRRAERIAAFYQHLAAQVGRPDGNGVSSAEAPLLADLSVGTDEGALFHGRDLSSDGQAEALWIGAHLERLALHAADLTVPASRLAVLRHRPWWR